MKLFDSLRGMPHFILAFVIDKWAFLRKLVLNTDSPLPHGGNGKSFISINFYFVVADNKTLLLK